MLDEFKRSMGFAVAMCESLSLETLAIGELIEENEALRKRIEALEDAAEVTASRATYAASKADRSTETDK